ncbi:hypothetical protein [Dongia sp.]|uniref:hypothetical protein n=1 Tax=Dongia sp. TaxID=1977262 RepID=UPI0035B04D53
MLRLHFICIILAGLTWAEPAAAKGLKPDPVPDAWLRAHADGSNSGFADVVTAPAIKIARSSAGLETIAFGAGPVIGQDGTVYVGNRQGTLFAFHADGNPAWSRQLPPGQEILAAPAIGADGSIYVIGVAAFTDDRVTPPFTRPDSTLHKFLPGGGYAWNVPFPEPSAALPISNGRGGTTAPPAIWSFGGLEVVMVPTVYVNRVGLSREVRLVAFSTEGPGVLDDILVTNFHQGDVTGSCGDDVLFCFIPLPGFQGQGVTTTINPEDRLPEGATLPLPGAAIYRFPGGGTPWIIVADQRHDIVGFTFSPQGGLVERMRSHDPNWTLTAPPLILPDTRTLVGGHPRVVGFRGQDIKRRVFIEGVGGANLARLPDGQTVVAVGWRGFNILQGEAVGAGDEFPGASIVPPAVSRSHFFISTASALYTYDAATMVRLAKLAWRGGGVSPPAIGPRGDVYAIAGNKLHVFPRPCETCAVEPLSATMPTDDGAAAVAPEPGAPMVPAAEPTSQGSSRFKKPMGPNGLRLHACTTLDGNECGRPAADAFCRSQGWAEADKYDVDSKKEVAETLSGEQCTKNKCKLFDYIECEN